MCPKSVCCYNTSTLQKHVMVFKISNCKVLRLQIIEVRYFPLSSHKSCSVKCSAGEYAQGQVVPTDASTVLCKPGEEPTWMTKSLPRKSAMVLGNLVRPHTKRRKRERSVLEKDSITSQNHWTKDAEGSIPLYVATDFRRCSGMSGLPHT